MKTSSFIHSAGLSLLLFLTGGGQPGGSCTLHISNHRFPLLPQCEKVNAHTHTHTYCTALNDLCFLWRPPSPLPLIRRWLCLNKKDLFLPPDSRRPGGGVHHSSVWRRGAEMFGRRTRFGAARFLSRERASSFLESPSVCGGGRGGEGWGATCTKQCSSPPSTIQ